MGGIPGQCRGILPAPRCRHDRDRDSARRNLSEKLDERTTRGRRRRDPPSNELVLTRGAVPGLCGVIDLVPGDEAAESRHILSGMAERLCLDDRYRIIDRLDLGPLHVAAVGYPSPCYQTHCSSGEEWTEIWFGELHHAPVTMLESAGRRGGALSRRSRLRPCISQGRYPPGPPPRPRRDRARGRLAAPLRVVHGRADRRVPRAIRAVHRSPRILSVLHQAGRAVPALRPGGQGPARTLSGRARDSTPRPLPST